MEKQKRWQFYLILAVLVLTLYNILPTVFYYTKPLRSPIDQQKAETVANRVVDRVNRLESDSKEWLISFGKLLGAPPQTIEFNPENPGIYELTFKNEQEAQLFKKFLPRAGSLIPFAPAELEHYSAVDSEANKVLVGRKIHIHLGSEETSDLFHYAAKKESSGEISPQYREVIYDRASQIALAFGGPSKTAQQLEAIIQHPTDPVYDEVVLSTARELVDVNKLSKDYGTIVRRYFSTFAQGNVYPSNELIDKFVVRLGGLKNNISQQWESLRKEQKKLREEGVAIESSQSQQLSILENQKNLLEQAQNIIETNASAFKSAERPLNLEEIASLLKNKADSNLQVVSLEGRNPFIESIILDWENDQISFQFYPDVQKLRLIDGKTETLAIQKERLGQLIINEIARGSRLSDEAILANGDGFGINLNSLTSSQSFLILDLGKLAQKNITQIAKQISQNWTPKHADLERKVYPVLDYQAYSKLSPEDQKLGLVIYAPYASGEAPIQGFKPGSLYVIARGMDSIIQKYQQNPSSAENQQFASDINNLKSLLQQNGFIGYSGSSYGLPQQFSKDYIFELDDYYGNLLKATREDFYVKGSKRYAVLDFTDVEQRILTLNKIDDREQEDLLKWQEEYQVAQVDLNATSKYLVPKPTKNPYWENFKLSFVKYFRGDDRKILKWGLDLSGGKTVRIGLRDHNNRPVTEPDDLKQAVNELYVRINKMGVAERNIHIENDNIILDFPGSQNLSASELVKASAMYFHIVNEKFSTSNNQLREAVNHFLQDVWNEAVVTNRKDIESINEIAWEHLGGEVFGNQETRPRSEYASILADNGLRLANPKNQEVSPSFNDSLSTVAMMRGDDFMDWEGQSHPLIFVFHNYALEGSSLTNIQAGYDPAEGNILSFSIKRSYEGSQDKGSGSPREDFYTWTSHFAEDKIVGTPKEAFSHGRGWRMAVILNGTVISKPALRAALRDGGVISGRFSQREVNQLAADLKAGSLSFTPKILSEQNVSPELGQEERVKGIVASIVAVTLVVIAMVSYYRFAGLVASCAVLLNILIMWGVLQNLDSALTLPAIAGIVLTIGMAVDANVLVFERVREEFKNSGRIASAIQTGYRKAFSAIFDSNITTIIAALILIQFDSGPIKGFAVTLIIGIISSMFTALFMTRYFFAGWVQNPKNKQLNMAQLFGKTNFNFLKWAKTAMIASLLITVIGTGLFIVQRKTIFGMDFTGGYSLVTEVEEKPGINDYRSEVANALLARGATLNDFQIRELSRPNQLRVQLGISMEEKGHPFYQLPVEQEGKYELSYQHNPRLNWVVATLESANLHIPPEKLTTLDRDWTVMSGQFSEAMRNNAIMALSLAMLCILVYITLRFEFKYALSAVVGLIFDVVVTLAIMGVLHWLGLSVQIDLQVVAAIMTIVGYSLNDTIIVFDRVREDLKFMRKHSFTEIVNHALNVTLSRTTMTSGTTLLVLLALVVLGGKSIFAFSLIMTIGVVVGTLSTWFVAAPALVYFQKREIEKKQGQLNYKKA